MAADPKAIEILEGVVQDWGHWRQALKYSTYEENWEGRGTYLGDDPWYEEAARALVELGGRDVIKFPEQSR